jgi:chromate reductase
MTAQAEPARTLEVLAIAGSLRRGSWNRRLLTAATALAPPDLHLTVYDDLASIPMFVEDHELTGHGVVDALCARVAACDGLLLSTPEYNRSIPGVLKNAIDWISRTDVLAGKPVAVIGATPGRWGTRLAQAELRRVLEATEAVVMPAPAVFVREVEPLFSADGVLSDVATRASVAAMLAAFARWIGEAGSRRDSPQG